MKKYYDALEDAVCSICADSDKNGICQLTDKETCAIKLFLPEIVNTVKKVDSEYFEDYYRELKNTVCKDCRGENPGEKCNLKDDGNCSLDRYFPIIVDKVKEVDAG